MVVREVHPDTLVITGVVPFRSPEAYEKLINDVIKAPRCVFHTTSCTPLWDAFPPAQLEYLICQYVWAHLAVVAQKSLIGQRRVPCSLDLRCCLMLQFIS